MAASEPHRPARREGTPSPPARVEFTGDMRDVYESLVSMTRTASVTINVATTALLNCDLEAVQQTAILERRLEEDRVRIERRTYRLMARQQPVAGDLRVLVSGIKIGADSRRMAALASHIGRIAARSYPHPAVPDELTDVFRKMGQVASRIADGAAVTLSTSDAHDAARLEVDDDTMDGLHRALFRELVADWPYGVETAVNVALLGRYYERFADHAVGIAQSVVYVVTGGRTHNLPPLLD